MNKHLSLLLFSVLVLGLSAWAQSGTSASTSPDSSGQAGSSSMSAPAGQASASGGNQQTLEGCIIQDEQDYYLEPLNGQEVRLHGSAVSQHVNHHVQVKGTEQSASTGGATSGSMAGSSAGANAPTDFLVTEVDMMSESCPANLKHRHAGSGSQSPGMHNDESEPK